MSTLIALRKHSSAVPRQEVTLAASSPRELLATPSLSPEFAAALTGLGFKPCTRNEPGDAQSATFLHLNALDAYIISTPDERQTEGARAIFDEDTYHLVRDIPLALSAPIRANRVSRRGRQVPWPEVSGIPYAHRNGITGEGVLVGVLDTGCDADHLELRKKRIPFQYIPLHPLQTPPRDIRGFDAVGHGTHVCGILAGKHVGVAPSAALLVVSVIESETLQTSLSRIVLGLDWLLMQFSEAENRGKPAIVNMSLGYLSTHIDKKHLHAGMAVIQQILSTFLARGILPIVAIGNEGPGTLCAPGYFPETLSVGAVDFQHEPAGFSGGGNAPGSGETQPNIAGYGVGILSSFGRDMDNRSFYVRMDGTSMATPYVAGIAALYASADATLKGEALRQHLLNTALPLQAPEERVGAGLARFL